MRVLLLGSSSSVAGAPVAAELARAFEVRAAGRSGWSVRSWLGVALAVEVPALGELGAGDVVLVYLPGNLRPRAGDVAELSRRLLLATRARVVWALPPVFPDGSPSREVAEAVAGAIWREAVPLVRDRVVLAAAELGADLVHPTPAGARRIVASWVPELQALERRPGLPGWWVIGAFAILGGWLLRRIGS